MMFTALILYRVVHGMGYLTTLDCQIDGGRAGGGGGVLITHVLINGTCKCPFSKSN